MKLIVMTSISLLAASVFVVAADEGKTNPTVKVRGLAIQRESKDEMVYSFNPGTTVEVLLSYPGRFIVGIDAKGSKLETFKDDKKTDLTSSKSLFAAEWLDPSMVRFSNGSSHMVFKLYAKCTPVEGASKVLIKATLAVVCGKDVKTVEKKNLPLKVGDKATLDGIAMTVQKGYPETQNVTVVFGTPERTIKRIEFFDSEGKAITRVHIDDRSGPVNGKRQYQKLCSLAVPVDPVSVRVTYFSATETITVPVDLDFGVGF